MKTTKLLLFPLLFAAMATMPKSAMSQVTIGADQPPQNFSVLELISNGGNALRLPQLDNVAVLNLKTQIEASSQEKKDLARGLTIYNSTRNCVQYWNGSGWIPAGICGVVIPSVDFPKTPGCPDSDPKPVTWMSYNLGAATSATIGTTTYDLTTPKGQMKWLTDKAANGGVNDDDATVYGGSWQWGRKDWAHAVDTTATPHIRYVAAADATTGQVSDINNAGIVFWKDYTNWYTGTTPVPDALWGNGVAVGTPTGTTPADGNPYNGSFYQKPVKTDYDPCPSGWRVPTQDEWETLGNYCNASSIAYPQFGGYFSTSANTNSTVTSVGLSNTGKAAIPTNNPNLVWVTVANGLPDATGWSASNPSAKVGGYALYDKTEWDNAAADYRNGIKPLYEAAAPVPLLFLPAAGYRNYSGSQNDAGYYGYYWSSTVNEANSHNLFFNSSLVNTGNGNNRVLGFSLRCVAE
ncbi:MAG: fibrobacter succinogenes major paralogous domain-containing protein [Prevotellaceae bacterium]|jgi:uncharacterized protein (TIGR02145 family)|nr:fibrobacter succinogenes major paralogous domain-containing protein [Prevotellaceae bacterium]